MIFWQLEPVLHLATVSTLIGLATAIWIQCEHGVMKNVQDFGDANHITHCISNLRNPVMPQCSCFVGAGQKATR